MDKAHGLYISAIAVNEEINAYDQNQGDNKNHKKYYKLLIHWLNHFPFFKKTHLCNFSDRKTISKYRASHKLTEIITLVT